MAVRARNIVCPLDFSTESLMALALATSYAERLRGTLWMVHVVKTQATADVWVRGEIAMKELDLLRSTVRRLTDGRVVVVPMVREGDVADEIRSLATEIGADLVVMAAHERTSWERCRDGSIVDELACQCPCPVVAVRSVSATATTPAARDWMKYGLSMN